MKDSCRLFIFLILLSSCSLILCPVLPSDPVPLIYGMINPQDSIYNIRLSKTFAGAGNALDFAKIPDSLYYQGAKVFLETRDTSGTLIQRVQMEETVIEDREPGLFAVSPNRIFRTDASQLHLGTDYFSGLGLPYTVNLHVKAVIPGYADTVQAVSLLRSAPRIVQPRNALVKIYLYSDETFWMQWYDTNKESMFQILIRMHYTDFLADTKREMTAEWVLSGIEVNTSSLTGASRTICSYYFRPENFYAQISSAIPKDPEVEARVCGKFDFIVLSSDKELEYYRNIYDISDDYHAAGYTNVKNGYGLFTTYTTTGIYGMTMGPTELDSLAGGRYTSDLKFKNW